VPAPGKITPPWLTKSCVRMRLHDWLDAARERPVVWISAPAGAGKTTLVSGYLRARQLPALWYQVDAGDVDIASFFYYLGLAAKRAAPRRRNPMPLLTPEYLAGLPTFTRNFFRELARRLNKPYVLVFDNLQELDTNAPLYEALQAGVSELPPHLRAILISRSQPPPAFARMQVSGQLVQLDWNTLRLRPEEFIQFARFLGENDTRLSVAKAARLYDQCEGWIAGLILLLQGAETATSPQEGFDPATAQIMFDYFAAEVFARCNPAVKELLMQTALFSSFTPPMAASLSGNPRAATVLNDLVRRHYFTERRAGRGAGYQYHPLFRAFLLAQARELWGFAELARRRHKAAALLEQAGRPEEALALFLDAGDWGSATRLLVQHAPGIVAQGRLLTFAAAIRRLPPEVCEQEPWLRYWLGVCCLPTDPGEALAQFEAAFARFERDRDATGAFLTWAGAAEAIAFQMSDYGQFERWLDRLDRLTRAYPEFPSVEIEARVLGAAIIACLWHRPAHPSYTRWLQRATNLLHTCNDPAACARVAFNWLFFGFWYGEDGAQISEMLEYATSLSGRLADAPFEQHLIAHAEASLSAVTHDTQRTLRAMERVWDIGARTGIHLMDVLATGMGAWVCFCAGNLARGDELLQRMKELLERFGTKLDRIYYWQLRSWRAAKSGDFPAAERHIALSLQLNEELGPVPGITNANLIAAHYHVEMGKLDLARSELARADELLRDAPGGHLGYARGMVGAQLALAENKEVEGCELLGRALRLSRRMGFPNGTFFMGTSLSRLCTLALERGIEPDAAREFIRKFQLAPPDIAVAEWPWPIEIYTLGRFGVVLDGQPLRFEGKAPRRPLELLMALVSLGGSEVGEPRLSEMLWEDAEADAAHVAFTSALHRLRKLLGDDEAILLRDNRLSLNPNKVWVDAWAFERALAESGTEKTAGVDAERVLTLYQGPFLGDAAAPWAFPAREKLRAKFLRFLTWASHRSMQDGRLEDALRLLEKGLEVEPLAEELYRRLMRCHAALGRRAEALAIYQRCRKMLAAVLGIEPTPETETLYRALRDNRPLPP